MRLLTLFEYTNIAIKLSSQFGDKIHSRLEQDASAPNDLDPEKFVGWLQDEIVPVPNAAYTTWLLRMYLNGGVQSYADFVSAKEILASYEKNRKRLDRKDINTFKSISELETYLRQNKLTTVPRGDVKRRQAEYAKKTTDVLYDGPEGKILWPRTETASCYYGRGTSWCISTETSKNYFNDYTHRDDVDIVFVLPNDGTKWAVVFNSLGNITDAFNSNDISIPVYKIFEKYPWVESVLEKTPNRESKPITSIISAHDLIQHIKHGSVTDGELREIMSHLPIEDIQTLLDYDISLIKFVPKLPEWMQKIIVAKNPDVADHIENLTKLAYQIAVVSQNPFAIADMKNPSEEVQLAAVKKDGDAINFIENPSKEVQLAAVSDRGHAINHIENPSEEVQLAAVRHDGYVIRFIQNPSEEVQIAAVSKDGAALQLIENPSEKVQITAVTNDSDAIDFIDDPSEEVQLAAVKQDGYAIIYIVEPSEDVQLAAVKQNATTIMNIDHPSEKVQLAAVTQNGNVIHDIENPSEEVKLAAVKQDGIALCYIKNPSEKMQWLAVNSNGNAIRCIDNPSEKLQLAAVKENEMAIRWIENPTKKVKKLAWGI